MLRIAVIELVTMLAVCRLAGRTCRVFILFTTQPSESCGPDCSVVLRVHHTRTVTSPSVPCISLTSVCYFSIYSIHKTGYKTVRSQHDCGVPNGIETARNGFLNLLRPFLCSFCFTQLASVYKAQYYGIFHIHEMQQQQQQQQQFTSE